METLGDPISLHFQGSWRLVSSCAAAPATSVMCQTCHMKIKLKCNVHEDMNILFYRTLSFWMQCSNAKLNFEPILITASLECTVYWDMIFRQTGTLLRTLTVSERIFRVWLLGNWKKSRVVGTIGWIVYKQILVIPNWGHFLIDKYEGLYQNSWIQ